MSQDHIDPQLPPVEFIGIIKRHIGLEPIRYDFYPGAETPHLFTFKTEGRGFAGQPKSFSINQADMQILMSTQGLVRIQSNVPGTITLYFTSREQVAQDRRVVEGEVQRTREGYRMPDQRSVTDQLETLLMMANKAGLYDAADWLKTRLETKR